MFSCRVCGSHTPPEYIVLSELMYGTREQFEYQRCLECGCLQIEKIPADMSAYYEAGYYSLRPVPTPLNQDFRRKIDTLQLKSLMGGRSLVGAVANRFLGAAEMHQWFTRTRSSLNSKILDVGCGNGRLLLRLQMAGFGNLSGIDPFLDSDIHYPGGLTVRRMSVEDVNDLYDVVMMNHSLEHVPDPLSTLRSLAKVTRPGGYILIRVPTIDCDAWDIYRENWVQLDAPRHLHIFSRDSIRKLAQRSDLILESSMDDSHAMQFWGSEQYLKGISLKDPRSITNGSRPSIFSRKQLREFAKRAQKLNAIGRGDQACFFLRRPD